MLASAKVEDTGPGAVRLIGKPGRGVNETAADRAHWADTATFSAFGLDPAGKYKPRLNFVPSFGLHQTRDGDRCAINLTFTAPGVWFYGLQANRNGLTQAASTACNQTDPYTAPCENPLALVIPHLNGSHPGLPAGFVGPVHVVQPLRTPHQFCMISPAATAFSGAQLKVPLCHVLGVSIPPQPRFASILAPVWLTVLGKTNLTAPSYTTSYLNQSKTLSPGQGPTAGSTEPRLQQTFYGGGLISSRWEIYNDFIRFYLTFPDAHAGKSVPVHLLLHDTLEELEAVEANPVLWQSLSVNLVRTPDLRPLLGWNRDKPTLMTALVWTDSGLFLNATTPDGSYSYLETCELTQLLRSRRAVLTDQC